MKSAALALGFLLLTTTAFAADVDGRWTGSMATPNGDVPVNFRFQTDGATLAR